MQEPPEEDWYEDEYKSKTQVKKEMLALQELGVKLTELTSTQLETLPLTEPLRKALEEAPKITQRSARKRHFQFIGKLMRGADSEAIQRAYDKLLEKQHLAVRQHHQIEHWRDQLLGGDAKALQEFVDQFPGCDIQQIRQLVRAALKESSQNKPPASARKLFKLVRECFENAAND